MQDEFPKNHLESLWAPWRVEYFESEHRTGEDFFGAAAETEDDASHLVITRRKSAFLMMNKYPYSAGHLMAVPYRKISNMSDLAENEVLELWGLAIHAQRLLEKAVHAQGFNIGWNLGKVSGAGVDDNLHIHIVPRWIGDSNFIVTIGGTRIIPQALKPLYERLITIQSELE